MEFFSTDNRTALEAKEYAQWIAFAPFVFQASRILRDSGVLEKVSQSRREGISMDDLEKKLKLSHYGLRVLLEAGLGIGLLTIQNSKFHITKAGYFILNDEMTKANMDFSQDVCYLGLNHLEASIQSGKPEGLKVFGDWSTIYEGLSRLPGKAKESWFRFDHYYSDNAFDAVLPLVMKQQPKKLMDIGGNTGKWSIACVNFNPDVHMTIVDLPGQTAMAKENIASKGLSNRVTFHEANVLLESTQLPKGYDGIWMSQFLDCFSDEQIISILKRCADALDETGYVYILETFWDRQRFEASAFSLQMTSLYFTAMANGNSQMYDSKVFLKLIEQAGLQVIEQNDDIGISHTFLKCKKK